MINTNQARVTISSADLQVRKKTVTHGPCPPDRQNKSIHLEHHCWDQTQELKQFLMLVLLQSSLRVWKHQCVSVCVCGCERACVCGL